MDLTTFNNQTYPTNTTAAWFSTTWTYPPGPSSQPVHAYPNVQTNSTALPITLDDLARIGVTLEWSYGLGNATATTTDFDIFSPNTTIIAADVAFDMFLDPLASHAGNVSIASHEVMIWFGYFGGKARPFGYDSGAVETATFGGTEFSLYFGVNQQNQTVSSWLASDPVTHFNGDLAPFLMRLTTSNTSQHPVMTDYLGYVAFGTETFSCNETTTFYVPHFSVDVEASG